MSKKDNRWKEKSSRPDQLDRMVASVARKSEFKDYDILKGIIGLSAGFSSQSVSAKTW